MSFDENVKQLQILIFFPQELLIIYLSNYILLKHLVTVVFKQLTAVNNKYIYTEFNKIN